MNKVIETMIQRRSCKNFKNDPLDQEVIDQIVQAGLHAPSGMNKQPTLILEVTNPEMVKKLSALNSEYLPSHPADPFYNCAAVLVVLADKSSGTYLYDGSLVMGNLLNAAASLNVGACWIHRAKEMFEDEEGKAILKEAGVEGDYEGIGNCVLGTPNVMPQGTLERKNRVVKIK